MDRRCFRFGFGGACYLGAVISDTERRRKARSSLFNWGFTSPDRRKRDWEEGDWKEVDWKSFWKDLTMAQKTVWAVVAANLAVLACWRFVPPLTPFMLRYFSNSVSTSTALCSPMLLSVFSHYGFIHFGLNMYVLNSFGGAVIDKFFDFDQFIAFYMSAGVFSSLAGMVHKMVVRSPVRAFGASGAILAVLLYTCMRLPDAQLQIVFLPFLTFSAGTAALGIVALDGAGLLLGWQMFDHAAHLGGSFFGMWYALHGQKLLWEKWRLPLEKKYLKMRYGDQ